MFALSSILYTSSLSFKLAIIIISLLAKSWAIKVVSFEENFSIHFLNFLLEKK